MLRSLPFEGGVKLLLCVYTSDVDGYGGTSKIRIRNRVVCEVDESVSQPTLEKCSLSHKSEVFDFVSCSRVRDCGRQSLWGEGRNATREGLQIHGMPRVSRVCVHGRLQSQIGNRLEFREDSPLRKLYAKYSKYLNTLAGKYCSMGVVLWW